MMKAMTVALGVLAASASAALSASYTLDFSGSGIVPDTYGDNGQADISYRAIDAANYGNVGTTGTLSFWFSGYGDLDGALWGNPDPSHAEIRIEAKSALETVTLDSFDMGGWAQDEDAEWFLYDLSWNEIGSGNGIAPNTGAHLSFAPNISAVGGIIFQWGADAWDVGVENFSYSVSGVAPVPLPASVVLLVAGLGALARLRKRA